MAQIGVTVRPPCAISASLTPLSGLRLPQILELNATGSTDSSSRPLRYFWGCSSGTNTGCTDFLTQANANGNTVALTYFQLYEADLIDITLTVCVANTNECAPQLYRQYSGASL